MKPQNTKKNHYIPRCLLKKFSDTNELLWCYDKKTDSSISHKYLAWGFEKYLYTQETEDTLAEYDSTFNQFMVSLESSVDTKTLPINTQVINDIATFLSIQIVRTPKAKERISKLIDEAHKTNPLYNIPFFRPLIEEFFNKTFYFETLIFEDSQAIFQMLTKFQWAVLKAPESLEFITNDQGFSLITNSLTGNNAKALGLESQNTSKIFPLSKKICLMITDVQTGVITKFKDIYGIPIIEVSSNVVRDINGYTFLTADRWVYGGSKELLDEAKISAESTKRITEQALSIQRD